MPRQQRRKSESGIYHVMLRGINQQQIFQDEEDNLKFLQIVKECKAISEFKLFAYCLMENHVHLLIKEGKEPIELIFKRIGNRFVYWYNTKYKRVGHLFQDRYRSEPVESDEYFLTVLRYIHQNPVKAGIVKSCVKYRFSSYNEYIKESKIIDDELAKEMLTKEEFVKYHEKEETASCLEIIEIKPRLTDEEAKRIIKEISGCENIEQFQRLTGDKQNEFIAKFRKKNISIRQISRLTGATIGIIRKFS